MFKTYIIKMKYLKNIFLGGIAFLIVSACDSNDDTLQQLSENKVDVYIQFDNEFDINDFQLKKNYSVANANDINISTLKYLITDIVFYGVSGTENYTVPTQESFHIVDASCESTAYKYFTNIPDGKYNKISIRYGVSEEVFELGSDAQGEMLLKAKEMGMNWSWTVGYRFLTYEGTYDGNHANSFKVHNGSHGSSSGGHGLHSHAKEENETQTRIDNSKVITMEFPNDSEILVSDATSPKVHLKVDISKILKGSYTLDVSEGNIIIDAHKSPKVAENIATMFSIGHIHPTDPNFDLPEIENCESSNPNDDHATHH
jgi:hypothetical protein